MNSRRRNTVRIDYDRLAETINNSNNSLTKEDIKEAIIEANKEIEEEKNKYSYSSEVLSFLVSPLMMAFSMFGVFIAGASIFATVKTWKTVVTSFISGFSIVLVAIMFVLAGCSIAYICWQASRELRKTNDYKKLSDILSSITSFVAMVVALVALYISIKI